MRPRVCAGLIGASCAWALAWAPTLLPLPNLILGISIGIQTAIGYGCGLSVGALVQKLRGHSRQCYPGWLLVAIPAVLISAALLASRWWFDMQQLQVEAVGVEAQSWLISSMIGAMVAVLLVLLGRGLAHLWQGFRNHIPNLFLRAGLAIVVIATVLGLNLLLLHQVFNRVDALHSSPAPTSATRSGGPSSLIDFDTLGRQGAQFVTGGSNSQTIRSYAGLRSAATPQQRADLAVADMLRVGGAQVQVWVGITTTGSGFVDPAAVAAIEELLGTEVALVATQYSTWPSALSFLVDQSAAQQAGTTLLQALQTARDQLPVTQRPRLFLYGESLGAFGSAAAFANDSPQQAVAGIDGALWVGPPAATTAVAKWRTAASGPDWQPIAADSSVLRFAATPASAAAPPPASEPWGARRILVLQNPTDPVVWWDMPLLWQRPSWFQPPYGPGMPEVMVWTPLSWLGIGLDLPPAVDMPAGYGHNYESALLEAWRAVLGG